jgi:hypothetical protein
MQKAKLITATKHQSIPNMIHPKTPRRGVPVGLLLDRVSVHIALLIMALGITAISATLKLRKYIKKKKYP